MATSPTTQAAQTSPRPIRRSAAIFTAGLLIGLVAGYLLCAQLKILPTSQRNTTRDPAAGGGPVQPAVADLQTTQPATQPDRSSGRPWAAGLDRPGLPNLHQVSEFLYRGGRPEQGGLAQLKAMGIKTIVNLQAFHGREEEKEAARVGLDYVNISFLAWHPEDEDVVAFLKLVTDPQRTPVFVHCMHGSDRTGTMCAIYRMAVQGWPKRQAIDEMTGGGFGFHEMWQNLVDYINRLDVEKIRRHAGLPATQPAGPGPATAPPAPGRPG